MLDALFFLGCWMLYFCSGCFIMLLNLASWGHMLTNAHLTFKYFILVLKDALSYKASFHYLWLWNLSCACFLNTNEIFSYSTMSTCSLIVHSIYTQYNVHALFAISH